jgi:co-chaperonin GroES (HSP10)
MIVQSRVIRMKIRPLPDKVLVEEIIRGERTVGGIVVPNDDGKEYGIRPRWGKVYAVGDSINDISIGEWVLIEHGRWSRELKISQDDGTLSIWAVDYPDSILLVTDERPSDETLWS